jgi:ankyrin repeat protein
MSSQDYEKLLHCIEYTDIRQLSRLLTENQCTAESRTGKWFGAHDSSLAIRVAIRVGDVDTIKLLIKHGADVSDVDNQVPPLCVAAARGELAVVQALLDGGAPPDPPISMRPITLAARSGSLVIVRVLLAAGAAVHRSSDALTPLGAAVEFGGFDAIAIVKALVDAGGDVNASCGRARPQKWIVHCARCHVVLRHLMSAYGIDIDARDERRRTGLLMACLRGNVAAVRALILAGANVDAVDKAGSGAFALLRHVPFDENVREPIWRMLAAAGCTVRTSDLRLFFEPLTSMDGKDRSAAVIERQAVAAVRCSLVRERATEIAIGLQSADLPVLVMMAILDECFYFAFAQLVSAFKKWEWLKFVKHFKPAQQ